MNEQKIPACENEPIHIPGRIQQHGFLIAFTKDSGAIRWVSENTKQYLEIQPQQLFGTSFSTFLDEHTFAGSFDAARIVAQMTREVKWQKNSLLVTIRSGSTFYLVFNLSDDLVLAEFEQIPAGYNPDLTDTSESYARILSYDTLAESANYLCECIRKISGFNRVMVYQFDEEYNGEVIAESSEGFPHSFMHHHFPAADIPRQARDLYLKNRMRIIANAHDGGSPILGAAPETPLDLTNSILRSVSSVHIRYLKNMGVGASYSISIVVKGKLWGLVTCHNVQPHLTPWDLRYKCLVMTEIFATNLSRLETLTATREKSLYMGAVSEVVKDIAFAGNFERIVDFYLNEASGAAYLRGEEQRTKGRVPSREQLQELTQFVFQQSGMSIYQTSALSKVFTPATSYQDIASGVLAVPVNQAENEILLWFKPEVRSTIVWAGNPEKVFEVYNGIEQLNPRNSFETWSQKTSGISESWNAAELEVAETLQKQIMMTANERAVKIQELHEELQKAYEEIAAFSYTVSHDLKTPLTGIKNYSELIHRHETLTPRGNMFLEKIRNFAEKIHHFINDLFAYTKIGFSNPHLEVVSLQSVIERIVEENRGVYGDRFRISYGELLEIEADKTLIYQAFSNLLGNAIKYSQQEAVPEIRIESHLKDDRIHYSIADNGIGMPLKEQGNVFKQFQRLSNTRGFEGTGLGLAITKRILDRHHATIRFESEEDQGTICHLTFPPIGSNHH